MELGSLETQVATQRIYDQSVDRVEAQQGAEDTALAARELEKVFSTLLVKELRRGLGDGFFGGGAGSDTFESWLDEHLGESLARDGVLDLAGQVKVELDRANKGAK